MERELMSLEYYEDIKLRKKYRSREYYLSEKEIIDFAKVRVRVIQNEPDTSLLRCNQRAGRRQRNRPENETVFHSRGHDAPYVLPQQ